MKERARVTGGMGGGAQVLGRLQNTDSVHVYNIIILVGHGV